jgi:cysteine-rich repeat protein
VPETCTPNGIVEPPEECDDGNENPNDGCVDCARARCGDGQVWEDVEDCDDGNLNNGDDCSSRCLDPKAYSANDMLMGSDQGHLYTRHDADATYFNAVSACRDLGGHLAVLPVNPIDYGRVVDLVSRSTGDTSWWFGLATVGGTWRWVDGSYLNEDRWSVPPSGMEDAAQLAPDGNWIAARQSDLAGRLCEIEGWVPDPTDETHLYRLYDQPLDWAAANALCQEKSGGHLATFETAEEANFIAELYSFPFWLGARAMDGTVEWVTGEPVIYAPWPTVYAGQCLTARSTGWNWFDCSGREAFVCEIDGG